jgi:uncharacterized protein (TIGR02246 family)
MADQPWIRAGAGLAVVTLLVLWGSARFDSLAPLQAIFAAPSTTQAATAKQEIEAFNKKYIEAHLKMDNQAIMATWAEDGVGLLPAEAPMIGKPAIAKFLNEVTSQMPGYQMQKVEMDFQGIEVSGDWASEWAYEHQVVQPPDGKPFIDSYGKLLLVLHRETDGNWRVTREMWNQGRKP